MTSLQIIILLERITGIVALGLLTLQIYLGANKKAIKFHMANGIVTYFFVLIHPILFLITRYITYHRFDFYFTFVEVCLLCGKTYEHLINLGRIGFYLVTIAVIAVKFKNISDWLKTNWRKLHILNYLAFYFVSFHSILIGTDSRSTLFLIFFGVCQIIVLYSLYSALKYWKSSH